ncbi:MAG: hypothetical protein ACI364_02825 [Coriobacteriales bacterium]
MSELDSNLVTLGKPVEGGVMWVNFGDSPTLPTDATTKMSTLEGWESVGELSEDGVTDSTDISTTTHKGMHGTPLIVSKDETEKTYKVTGLEFLRAALMKLRYGVGNVTSDGETWTTIEETTTLPDVIVPIVFDFLCTNGELLRTVVKKAQVTDIDDGAWAPGDMVGAGLTFTVLDPADGTAKDIIHYKAKPITTTTTTTSNG